MSTTLENEGQEATFDIEQLEQWGRNMAARENQALLQVRLETLSQRPPLIVKPQTVAFVEEGLRILGFGELAAQVRTSFRKTLNLFVEQLKQRQEDQVRAVEMMRELRAADNRPRISETAESRTVFGAEQI